MDRTTIGAKRGTAFALVCFAVASGLLIMKLNAPMESPYPAAIATHQMPVTAN